MVETGVQDKDIVQALFGGTLSVAGLLLVFIGYLFSVFNSFDIANTTQETLRPYKVAIVGGVAALVLNILVVAAALIWLFTEEHLWITIALFSVELAALPLLAGVTTYLVLRK